MGDYVDPAKMACLVFGRLSLVARNLNPDDVTRARKDEYGKPKQDSAKRVRVDQESDAKRDDKDYDEADYLTWSRTNHSPILPARAVDD
jgi:hypothetical protein